jgi:hypothetical protein
MDTDSHFVKELIVTKLDSAKRQFEAAIQLFFHNGDPVAIHTLTAAAHQVCHGIAQSRGIKSEVIFNESLYPKDTFAKYKKQWLAPENFFKHAREDPDPDGSIVFDTMFTAFYLIDGVDLYHAISGQLPAIMRIFRTWYRIAFPLAFADAQDIINEPGMIELGNLPKPVFFGKLLNQFLAIERENELSA